MSGSNSYENYYDWLAPKLSKEERSALDVIYEAAKRSYGPESSEVVPSVPAGMEFPERNDAPLTTGDLAWQREIHALYWPDRGRGPTTDYKMIYKSGDTSGLSDMTAYSATLLPMSRELVEAIVRYTASMSGILTNENDRKYVNAAMIDVAQIALRELAIAEKELRAAREMYASAQPEVMPQWQRFKGYGMASTVFDGDGLLLADGVKFIYRVEGDHIIAMSAPSRPTEEK